jgi:hypothetical protein
MVFAKLAQLHFPLVPEFREAMQKEHQRPFAAAAGQEKARHAQAGLSEITGGADAVPSSAVGSVGENPQAHAADLTINELKNSKYFIPSWEEPNQGEWVQLKDGEFDRKDPNNPLLVKIVAVAIDPLPPDQKKGAAVIYGYSTGGTGFFVVLCAVTQDEGKLKNSGLVDLEDRVHINSLNIQSGKIVVDMLTHGPHDAAPFPTVRKIVTYTLVGNKLLEK